jgi:4-amino-4-deoxy-L-arabinose transferase-like glycosyltransferase
MPPNVSPRSRRKARRNDGRLNGEPMQTPRAAQSRSSDGRLATGRPARIVPTRPAAPRPEPDPPFFRRHGRLALAVLFIAALVWRLAYLARLSDAALIASLLADERIYWDWATYLLSNDYRGSNPYFFGPLYPYVLALVRAVAGSDVARVLIVQAVWGAAGAVLIADAARRLTGWPIGLAAGIVYAFYEMNVFFDGLILMESLLLFLEALLLWLWTRAAEPRRRTWLLVAIGVATGLIALGRAPGALLLLPAWWLVRRREGETWRPTLVRMAVLAGVFTATIAPATLHNWRVSREFIPFTYNFGLNFYIGHHEGAIGLYKWVAGPQGVEAVRGLRPDGGIESDGRDFLAATEGLDLSPRESSDAWARKAWAWMRVHPVDVLRLAGSKVILMWNRHEQYQIESADMYRARAGPLGLPVAGTFLFVGILGLVGMVHARVHPIMGPALRLYVVIFMLGMLPFFVTDRYRIHLVPALVLLGALAVLAWSRRAPGLGRARAFLIPAGLAAGLVFLPIAHLSPGLQELFSATDMGTRWLDQGRPDLALVEYEKAIRLEAAIPNATERITPDVRGAMFFNYAYTLRASGRMEEALGWFRRAAEASPLNPRFSRTLADAYRARGRASEADSLLTHTESLFGSATEVLMSRGYEAARQGNLAEAESLFAASVDESMRHYAAWGALIRVQVQQGALGRAHESADRFAKTGAEPHRVRLYEAFVFAASGDPVRARAALAEVPDVVSRDDPTLRWVRETTEKLIAAGAR